MRDPVHIASPTASDWSAHRNSPAANSRPFTTRSACTSIALSPIGDHVDPFQRATAATVAPPACVNSPPTTRSPFERRERVALSVETVAERAPGDPSQRAMLLAATPPAAGNRPVTMRSEPYCSAAAGSPTNPPTLKPEPSGCHAVPIPASRAIEHDARKRGRELSDRHEIGAVGRERVHICVGGREAARERVPARPVPPRDVADEATSSAPQARGRPGG